MVIVPVLSTSPVVPARTAMPVPPLALPAGFTTILPALETALLLSIVTAVPPVSSTDPAAAMSMVSGAPALIVEVWMGAVFFVEIVSARAGRNGALAASAITAVVANRFRRMKIPQSCPLTGETETAARSLGGGLKISGPKSWRRNRASPCAGAAGSPVRGPR